jgi:hypothetical protein
MNIAVFTHVPMKLNNLKIYCQTEEDQTNIVEFIFSQYEDVEVSTWEPDPVDTGTWGMFVDEFPPELWGKLEQYLESEDSWELDEEVEMELECEEPRVTKSYP